MLFRSRIKSSIPAIISEIDREIESLRGSQNFLDKIINESDNGSSQKLSLMAEKLVGSSHERSKFEDLLKSNLHKFLLEYMDKVFNYDDSNKEFNLENNLSQLLMDGYIYGYHVQNNTNAIELAATDDCDLHKMLNSGLISSVTINNETLQKAFKKESTIAALIPIFELSVNDPLNIKRMELNNYLGRYFSSLQNNNVLQDKVYNIIEEMLFEYISSTSDDELSKHFIKYIVKTIGQSAFEDKMRYTISSLVNIEQRQYVNIYDILRQIIIITKSPYLDFTQFYRVRRMFSNPNSNKINLELYSDLWNQS